MNAVDVLQDWLDQYLNFEHTPKKGIFWLDTIQYLCSRFNNPESAFKTVHVAGSKGKGSVSRMISCILESAGYNTGVYSSPHITDFRERISKPTSFFEEEIYEKALKEMAPRIESILPEQLPGERPLTWFELVTLYSFLVFRQAKCDYGVFEVGLGGRLDSTNIIEPEICCLMPIELEHTEFLGNTLEKIAYEKAGIIKDNTPVLVFHQNEECVNEVFKKVAKEHNAPIYFLDQLISKLDYSYENERMLIKIESSLFNRPVSTELSLIGEMQAQNACMAAVAVKLMLPEIDEKFIEGGLSKAKLPGRFEIISDIKSFPDSPKVILDGAHTVNSVRMTINTVKKLYKERKVNVLFACAADKDVQDIAKLFKGNFNHIFLTKPGSVKESNIEKAREAFESAELDFIWEDDYEKFIPKVLKQTAKDDAILLITGSFYLLAEAKKTLGIW